MGGGYGAPRPGCALYAEKITRYGDVYPGKYPFSRRPENPTRPAGLFSSTQPARVDFRPDKIKAPEEYPGAQILGLWSRCPTLPEL